MMGVKAPRLGSSGIPAQLLPYKRIPNFVEGFVDTWRDGFGPELGWTAGRGLGDLCDTYRINPHRFKRAIVVFNRTHLCSKSVAGDGSRMTTIKYQGDISSLFG